MKWRCPGASRAALSTIPAPTGSEPVKAIASTSGCSTSAAPVFPSPWVIASAAAGTPAASRTSASSAPQPGYCSAGFITTALPAARAPAVIPQRIATGKFQGAITATTPSGA